MGAAGAAPPVPPAPALSEMPLLLDAIDDLEAHLSAQHSLREHGLLQAMAEYKGSDSGRGLSPERGKYILRGLARQAARCTPAATSAQWKQTLEDMLAVWERACRADLPAELPYYEWMQSLLLAGHFRLAADYLKTGAAADLLQTGAAEALVLAAAREYFNAAASAADPTLDLSAECLRVLPSRSAAVAAEHRLVEGMRTLAGLGCALLPLQVRLHTDRVQIVVDLVAAAAERVEAASAASGGGPDGGAPQVEGGAALRQGAMLERLVHDLGVPSDDATSRVVDAVARLALAMGDTTRALELTTRLVSGGFAPAWRLCLRLCTLSERGEGGAGSEGFRGGGGGGGGGPLLDSTARGMLLAHALAHCPQAEFTSSIALWRQWRRASASDAAGTPTGGEPSAFEAHRRDAESAAEGSAGAPPEAMAPARWLETILAMLRRSVAAGEDDLAVALALERPSPEAADGFARALSELLEEAASLSDAAEVGRVARLAVQTFGVLAAAVASPATPEEAATSPLELALRSQTCSEISGLAARATPPQGGVEAAVWRAARSHLATFEAILQRLDEATEMRSALPNLDVAQYATSAAARTAAVGRLATSASDGAFQQALRLAHAVGLDRWDLRLACVQQTLVRHAADEAADEAGAARSAADATAELTAAVEPHMAELLEQPARLVAALAGRTYADAPFGGVLGAQPLVLVLHLLERALGRLRAGPKHERTFASPGMPIAGAGDAPRAPTSLEAIEASLALLGELCCTVRALAKAAPACDVRSLLALECDESADGRVALTVALAPGALQAFEDVVDGSTAPMLALLAPQLDACAHLAKAGGKEVGSPFTSSRVWATRLRALATAGVDEDDDASPCLALFLA